MELPLKGGKSRQSALSQGPTLLESELDVLGEGEAAQEPQLPALGLAAEEEALEGFLGHKSLLRYLYCAFL